MDRTSLNEQPTEPQGAVLDQDYKKKKGFFEILLGGIILVLLTGVLNYFNILPISRLFPNYLGFLPYRVYEQPQKYKNVTIAPTVSPSVSLLQPAKQTLIGYLPTILNSPLLPKSSTDLNLNEDKDIQQNVSGTWNTKDGKAITIFTVSPNGKEIVQLLIFFPYAATSSISAEFAQSTIPELFSIIPKGKWACDTIPNTANYCEIFWEEQNGVRRGIVLKESLPLSQAKIITISFCEHSQNSRLYSWKSCASEFAQTGVTS